MIATVVVGLGVQKVKLVASPTKLDESDRLHTSVWFTLNLCRKARCLLIPVLSKRLPHFWKYFSTYRVTI